MTSSQPPARRPFPPLAAVVLALFSAPLLSHSQDLFTGNRSAAAMSVAGADIAAPHGALAAVSGNAAGLASVEGRTVEVGGLAIFGHGRYTSPTSTGGHLDALLGAAPAAAFVTSLGHSPWHLSLSATPDTSLAANWSYNDAPGTAGVTYGYRQNKSALLNERFAAGLARPLGRRLSVGVTAGVVYDSTTLIAPTIFQHQPVLQGLKTLLTLRTSGVGVNGTAGLIFAPTNRLRLAASYKSPTDLHTTGTADGNLGALLAALGLTGAFQPDFHYAAALNDTLPQIGTLGMSWSATPRTRLFLSGDFVNWHNSFDHLSLHVTGGDNADLNGLVGADQFRDTVPLEWRNQGILHAGIEAPLTHNLILRGGYLFANNPVPAATLTPLTAAITQQTLAAGAGYHRGRYNLDFAYQAGLPASESVTVSSLRAGEYNSSETSLSTQTIATTFAMSF